MSNYTIVGGDDRITDDVGSCGMLFTRDDEDERDVRRETMYERTRRSVYATGNKWAIENFHATHD